MDITAARTELAVYLRDALIDDAGGVDPTLSNLHWGDADLDVCLRTALGVVASLRADSYKKRFTLTTVSGSVQDVPEGCDECTGILGVMDGDRLDTSRLRKVKGSQTLGLAMCGDASSRTSEVSISEDDTTLVIEPPLPPGTDVLLMCKYVPSFDDDSPALEGTTKTAMFLLAVSLAFGQDIESVQSRERSDSFWQRGMGVLSVSEARSAQIRQRLGNQ